MLRQFCAIRGVRWRRSGPDETVGAAVDALVSRNIGALVASEDGESVDGIISERDIVHALADHGAGLLVADRRGGHDAAR